MNPYGHKLDLIPKTRTRNDLRLLRGRQKLLGVPVKSLNVEVKGVKCLQWWRVRESSPRCNKRFDGIYSVEGTGAVFQVNAMPEERAGFPASECSNVGDSNALFFSAWSTSFRMYLP